MGTEKKINFEKMLIDLAPNCLIIVNLLDFSIAYKNNAANNLFTRLGISSQSFLDIFDSSEKDKIYNFLSDDKKTEDTSLDIDCRLNSKKELWVNIKSNKTNDRCVVCLVDVTKNRKKLSRIEISESLLNEAQEIAHIGSFNLNIETKEDYWSLEGYNIFELDPSKVTPSLENLLKIIHPEDVSGVLKVVDHLLKTGEKTSFQYRVIMPDGRVKILYEEARGFLDEKGQVKHISGFFQDISNISEIKKKLQLEQNRVIKILSSIEEVVYFTKITGPELTDREIEFISPNCEVIYGTKDSDFYSKGPSILIPRVHPEDLNLFQSEIQKLITKKSPITFSLRLKRVDSTGYDWIEHSLVPSLNKNNEVVGYSASARNINFRKEQEEIIKKEREKFKKYLDITEAMILVLDKNGNIEMANPKCARVLDSNVEDMLGKNWFDNFIPVELRDELKKVFREIIMGNISNRSTYENEIISAKGCKKLIQWQNNFVKDSNNNIIGTLSSGTDLTDLKLLESELEKKERKYKSIFDNAMVGIFRNKFPKKKAIDVNESFWKLFGYDSREDFMENFYNNNHYADSSQRDNISNEVLSTGKSVEKEVKFLKKDGSEFWGRIFINYISELDESEIMIVDITKRKEYENMLITSRDEQELLLKEVHHRVKNNLQIIIGLIEMDSNQSKPDNKITINRIKSIAQIHDLLYKSPVLGRIDIKIYIDNFLNEFNVSYPKINIDFDFEISTCYISIEQAIPIGIILNEVITNIYKHAFDTISKGKVIIKLFEDDDIVFFEIKDNGKGLPMDFNYEKSKSLGFTLITALAKQINGKLKIKSINGTTFQLIFKKT